MRLLTQIVLVMMLVFAVPVVAQEDSEFDPEADFTNTYTLDNITIRYPDVVTVAENNFQISLAFDESFRDYIVIATPKAFDYFSIPNDTLDIASRSVFDLSPGEYADERTYEEAVSIIEFAGYDNVLTFEREVSGTKVFTFTLMIGDDIFAAILITQETVFSADIQLRVLERVLESLSIGDEAIIAEATPDAVDPLATPTSTFETRTAPSEAVELSQDLSLYDGEMRLSIPSTWVLVEDDGNYRFATSASVAEVLIDSRIRLDEGDIALQIIHPDRMSELGLAEVTIANVIDALPRQFADSSVFVYDGLPYEAYLIFVGGMGVPEGAFFIVFQAGEAVEDVAAMVGVTPDYDAAEGLILAIINTIEYTRADSEG